MRTHIVKIVERRGSISDRTLIQGTVGEDEVVLDLDAEWEGLDVLVSFKWYGGSIVATESDGAYLVPWECNQQTGEVNVVVEGSLDGKTMRHAIISQPMTVLASEGATGASASDPTVDEYQQAYENAKSATDAATAAASSANTAASTANTAATKADTATTNANTATTKANEAAAEATAAAAKVEIVDDDVKRNALEIIGQYAGRDLSVVLADEIASGKTVYDALHARVQAGNYEGLRIGDYIDVALTDSTAVTASATQRFLIAHFDPYRWCGDTAKGRHIAFVAATSIAVSSTYPTVVNSSYVQWNTTATNQGSADDKHPYTGSNLKAWETAFEACLPTALSNYLLTQRVLLEERYSASGSLTDSNGWSWANIGKVWSLSETEVYGQCVWGTKGYSVGFDCQFDLFHDTAHRINNSRVAWWLRSAASGSASSVCLVSGRGYAYFTSAAAGWFRPRVGFLLG